MVYERLNEEAKEVFDLKLFKEEIEELCEKKLLFFIKALYEYSKKYSVDIIIHDSKDLFKKYRDFLEYYSFKIDNMKAQNRSTSSMVIELVNPSVSLYDYLNYEYDFNIIVLSREENLYLLLPKTNDMSKSLVKLYTSIDLHFNEYSQLEVNRLNKEEWNSVFEKFITVEIKDR